MSRASHLHARLHGLLRFAGMAALACAALLQPHLAGAQTQPQPQAPAAARLAAAPTNEYVLAGGDVVRITVYQNPDLTLEARLSEAGVVSYPLLGSLGLAGRSVAQAEALIADGLRTGGFVRQPQVNVSVIQVRGNQANVLGSVNRPGRYPLEAAGLRITDLLAMAGGVAPNGADVVKLIGTRNGQPYRASIDLPRIFANSGAIQDIPVQNGDVMYVERAPTAYIYGEVQRPGSLRIERNMTLMQGLAAGGGLTQRGTERGLRIHRRSADGNTAVLRAGMNEPLQDGDVIYVSESLI